MNGLRYIREYHNISLPDLADMLKVSKQIVSSWETNKKAIPPKRLHQLSTMFNISEEYFKEISDVQELEIDNVFLNKAINDSEVEYEAIGYDDEGKPFEYTATQVDTNLVEYLDYNKVLIEKKELLKKIDSIISKSTPNEVNSLYEIIGNIDKYIRLFNRFADVTADNAAFIPILFNIIRALELVLEVNQEEQGKFNDEDGFVKRLVKIITSEYKTQEEMRLKYIELIKSADTDNILD